MEEKKEKKNRTKTEVSEVGQQVRVQLRMEEGEKLKSESI